MKQHRSIQSTNKALLFLIKKQILRVILACTMLQSLPVSALDVLPGAYTPLPAGTDIGQFFYTHTERKKQFVKGNQRPINARLDSDIKQLRYIHYMDIAGYRIQQNIMLPFGKLEASQDSSALGSASGQADLALSTSIWLVNNPETNTYFGITPHLSLPTGDYDKSKALNLGENRWKLTLQAGLNAEITNKIHFDLVTDITTYGSNTEFGAASATLKQARSYQATIHMRYIFSPAFQVSAGWSTIWGGETEVNGVKKGNPLRTTKYILGTAYFFRPSTQFSATYSRDLSVKNGFMVSNRFLLRLSQAF